MLAIFLSAGNAFSQSGEKYSVSGNSLNTGDVIGSKNAIDMVFITNNTKWMWLTKKGNLGIGESKPFHKFEVAGRSRFIGNMYVDSVMFALSIEAAVLAKTASLLVMQNAVVNGTVTIGNALTLNGQASSITSASGTITFLNNNINTSGNIKANLLTANGLTDGTNMTNVTELCSHLDNAGIHAPLNDDAVTTANVWSAAKINNELIQAVNPDTIVANAVKTNSLFSGGNLYVQSNPAHQNTFFNSYNNNKVCIGTNMTLPVRLLVTGSHDSTASIGIARYSNDTKGPLFVMMKARGTQLSPLAVAQGDELGRVVYGGYDGVKFVKSDVLRTRATENYSPAGCGSSLEFTVTPNGNTSPVVAMLLEQDQTATFSNTIFTPKLSIGVPSPQVPLDVQGSAIVRGWLFVEDGVVVGKRFQGGAAEVDTLRPAPQSEAQEVIIPRTKSEYIVSDTLKSFEVEIQKAAITEGTAVKFAAEKITVDTVVTQKMELSELRADTLTGQKMEAAKMVTDTMYSYKVQTDKIETNKEIKVGPEIVIDGTTGKISASGLVSNDMTINGAFSLPNLVEDIPETGKLLFADVNGNVKSLSTPPSNLYNINNCIKATTDCSKIGIGQSNPKDNLQLGEYLTFHNDASNSFVGRNLYYNNGSYVGLHANGASALFFGDDGSIKFRTLSNVNYEQEFLWQANKGLFINSNGDVGIGTETPGAKLHVYNGNIINGGADFILGKDDGRPHVSTNYRALVHDGYANQQDLLAINYAGDFADGVVIDGPKTYINGTLEVNNTVKLLALSGIQNPQFMLVSDGDGNLGTKQLNGFNPECITTDVNCNVGIGTETPGAKLHVYNGNIINGGADFILGKDDGRPHVSTNYRALVHDGYAKQQDLLAINYAGDFADGVVIDGPKTIINKQLDIKGGSGEPLQGQIHITGNGEYGGPGDAYISFYEGSEPGSVWSVGAKDVGNCFTISNSLSTDNNVKFVISEATGNVGINITNPNSKLEITDAGTSEPPQGQVHITGRNTTDKGDAFISFTDGTANCSYTNEWSVGANDALCGFTISNSKQIDNNVKFIIRGENVGIGTSWPNSDAKLHVYENAINKIAIVAGDTTANSIWLVPKIGCCGSFNTISKEGDVGIIFRNGDQNQGTPPAGLVLAPHNTTDYIARGIRIDPNGNVGIGVKDPQSRLHIKDGHGCLTLETSASTEDGYSDITFKDEYYGSNDATNRTWVIRAKNHAGILQNPANSLEFWSIKGGQMQIIGGNVLIGSVTHNDVHNLYVNGNIWAKEVRVKSTNPYVDYVFKEDYKLMNLYILEKFIRENRHLPEIPTEADVPKDGIDLEQMNILLLKKVEELTLYTIEQQKMIDVMKSEIEILKSK